MNGNLKPLLGLTAVGLRVVAQECGMPRFAAGQMADWLYKKKVKSVDAMSNLSKRSREVLNAAFEVGTRPYTDVQVSRDGTRKYLFPALNGGVVETVYIPEGKRATLCVSSQVGCKMNCSFCLTGKQGFGGQLTVCDILNQIVSVEDNDTVTNIVFMGQGEPMDNYENVLIATEILTSDYGLAMSPKRITVSSVGVTPALKRFCHESRCNIAVSLHSPFHEERMEMMPIEKAYPISGVVDMLKRCEAFRDCRHGEPRETSRQRRLSFEYILLKDKNDSRSHANALVNLLKGLDCRVNLIPFHGYESAAYMTPAEADINAFCDYLNRHGLITTVRKSRGQEISAACGMLAAHTAKSDAVENKE